MSRATASVVAALVALTAFAGAPPEASGAAGAPTKVLTIVEENHSESQALATMPYLALLARTYAYGSHYHAITHPSLPNYVAIAGGDTFGITSDYEPIPSAKIGSHHSVFWQATNAGRTAKIYAESMSSNCQTTASGNYVPRHNPWVYFGSERTTCSQYDVPATSFLTDARSNALPNAGMLVPNLCNDAHSCSLATADNWLEARLPTVFASSDFTSGRLTVVVTFDEDDGRSGNSVLTVVMNSGMTKHGAVGTTLSHYSLTGYYEHVLGVSLLSHASTGFAQAFGLR